MKNSAEMTANIKKISRKIVIIGGGASGMTAAVSALEEAKVKPGEVLLLESNDRVGKKILATGNGKCNFTHEKIDIDSYYTDDREVLQKILDRFPTEAALHFFESAGMLYKKKNGCFYPLSETASTVLDVLRLRLSELPCDIWCNVTAERIRREKSGKYLIQCYSREEKPEQAEKSGKADVNRGKDGGFEIQILADAVIIAAGSKAGGFLRDRQADPLSAAKALGLTVTPLYPALTKCICRESFYKAIANVRVQARLRLYESADPQSAKKGLDGWNFIRQEEGELQLTKEGISGIVVFQLSGDIAQKLAQKKRLMVEINFLPDFAEEKLEDWVKERFKRLPGRSLEDFFLGVLHKKLLYACLQREGLKPAQLLCGRDFSKECSEEEQEAGRKSALRVMKRAMHFTTEVTGVSDIRQAQVCRGGISLTQFNERLECKKMPGLFACGEVLNVDGLCGGYNLHFAWASGYLAGKGASDVTG